MKRGFTLIELIVVISAIAILAGIIVPSIGSLIDESKLTKMKSELKTLESAALMYDFDTGQIPRGELAGTTLWQCQVGATANIDQLLNYSRNIPGKGIYNFSNYVQKRPQYDPWNTSYGYYEAVSVAAMTPGAAGVVVSYGPDAANGPTVQEWNTGTWNARTNLPSTNKGEYKVFKINKP